MSYLTVVFSSSFQSMYVSWNMHCKNKNNTIFLYFIHKKCFFLFCINQYLKLLYFLNLNCIYDIRKKLNILSYDMSIFLLTIFFFFLKRKKTLLWSIQMTNTIIYCQYFNILYHSTKCSIILTIYWQYYINLNTSLY